MDLSKQKKPSRPRLATNIPPECQPLASVSLMRKVSQEINVQPKSDRPVPVHSLVPEKDENIAPTVCYTSDLKALYPAKGFEEVAVARKKAQYYEDAFTARGSHNSPQDRVTQDSFVVAELKTNKMVGLVCTCQS